MRRDQCQRPLPERARPLLKAVRQQAHDTVDVIWDYFPTTDHRQCRRHRGPCPETLKPVIVRRGPPLSSNSLNLVRIMREGRRSRHKMSLGAGSASAARPRAGAGRASLRRSDRCSSASSSISVTLRPRRHRRRPGAASGWGPVHLPPRSLTGFTVVSRRMPLRVARPGTLFGSSARSRRWRLQRRPR
jgi:hypothetical protein